MHIHILGICGTFMGGLAQLARAAGHRVSGSDSNVYPPMSTQLQQADIDVRQGYEADHLQPPPDQVVVGNAMSRGNPAVEYMLDTGLSYTSGPQWLREHVLEGRQVIAVAGTHGKTTTSSILVWILEAAGARPGFLIGGVPGNFGVSARLGEGEHFVIEADEYDTAFFDKRSKFVHYRPHIAVLNNLEFDHADIFDDLAAIQRQFHHLVRLLPSNGRIVVHAHSEALDAVLAQGCWTPVERFGEADADWALEADSKDWTRFTVLHEAVEVGQVDWPLAGRHNAENALAAVAAASHAGVAPADAARALRDFEGVKRRLELRARVDDIAVYDDFAHHPTAIRATLEAMRGRVGDQPVVAVLEPRSNTMRMGVHRQQLAEALRLADRVAAFNSPGLQWNLTDALAPLGERAQVFDDTESLVRAVAGDVQPGTHVVVMSNGAFDNVHARLVDALRQRSAA